MEWEKADLNLAAYLETLLSGYMCSKKPMFGAPVYFVNDNMWTGVKGGKAFLRLSEQDRVRIQTESDEIKPFEPRPAFFMKEYVEIPESKLTEEGFMRRWLKASYDYTVILPPKVKKGKKPKPKKN